LPERRCDEERKRRESQRKGLVERARECAKSVENTGLFTL
jgi:hypothetical protein